MLEVQETVARLVFKKTGHHPKHDDTLASLEIDSLAMAELTVELEKVFGVRVGEDVLDVQTVQELNDYLTQKIAHRELA